MYFVLTPLQGETDGAEIRPKTDTAHFLNQVGFTLIYYSRYVRNNKNWQHELLGALAAVHTGDIVVYQTPTYAGQPVEDFIVATIHDQGAKVIGLVHDVEYLRFPQWNSKQVAIDYYNAFDALIVATDAEKQPMIADGVHQPIVLSGPWGYNQEMPPRRVRFSHAVHYAGNLVQWKAGFLADLPAAVHINVYGRNDGSSKPVTMSAGVTSLGVQSQERLASMMDNGFGLIWDAQDAHSFNPYAAINMPHKFSLYMSLGLPVIAKAHTAIGEYVEHNDVGLVVNNIAALNRALADVDAQGYDKLLVHVSRLGDVIRTGRHVQLAALKAVMAVEEITAY